VGFQFTVCAGLLGMVLWGGSPAVAGSSDRDREDRKVTVLVNDSAHVAPSVLREAEIEAARIFRAAGVEIEWVGCSGGSVIYDDRCRVIPGDNQYVLQIVPTGKTSSDLVFGLAFLDEDGTGRYCDVFYERIAEAHHESGADPSLLLGMVVAHELGHLLLGSHAHSYMGIMTPVWKADVLRRIDMGSLLFTHEQASIMKARIVSQGGNLISVGRVGSALPAAGGGGRRRRLRGFLR